MKPKLLVAYPNLKDFSLITFDDLVATSPEEKNTKSIRNIFNVKAGSNSTEIPEKKQKLPKKCLILWKSKIEYNITSLEQVKNLRIHQELAGEDAKVQDPLDDYNTLKEIGVE